MSRDRKYERNSCFYLWIYRESDSPEMEMFPVNEALTLPSSQKIYKTNLKHVKIYADERITLDDTIKKIEIERATHVGSAHPEVKDVQ